MTLNSLLFQVLGLFPLIWQHRLTQLNLVEIWVCMLYKAKVEYSVLVTYIMGSYIFFLLMCDEDPSLIWYRMSVFIGIRGCFHFSKRGVKFPKIFGAFSLLFWGNKAVPCKCPTCVVGDVLSGEGDDEGRSCQLWTLILPHLSQRGNSS